MEHQDDMLRIAIKYNGNTEPMVEAVASGSLEGEVEDIPVSELETYKRFLADNGIQAICLTDDSYPQVLKKRASTPPLVLLAKGDQSLLDEHLVFLYGENYPVSNQKDAECSIIKATLDVIQSGRICVTIDQSSADYVVQKTCAAKHAPSILVLTSSFDDQAIATSGIVKTVLDNGGLVLTQFHSKIDGILFDLNTRDALVSVLLDGILGQAGVNLITTLREKTDSEALVLCSRLKPVDRSTYVVMHPIYANCVDYCNVFVSRSTLKPYLGLSKIVK